MSDHIIGSGDMVVPVTQIGYNGVSKLNAPGGVGSTIRALSHHEGDAIVTTSTYYTNSTPQLNSPADAKPEFDLPRVLPCYTCKWYEWGEWADDTCASVWAEPFCMRGLYLPTKKLTCKRHEQDGAR